MKKHNEYIKKKKNKYNRDTYCKKFHSCNGLIEKCQFMTLLYFTKKLDIIKSHDYTEIILCAHPVSKHLFRDISKLDRNIYLKVTYSYDFISVDLKIIL